MVTTEGTSSPTSIRGFPKLGYLFGVLLLREDYYLGGLL